MSNHNPKYKKQTPSELELAALQLKVCGMKHNTDAVASLHPDYLGFIFYEKSPRDYDLTTIRELQSGIKKVGVFVNASLDFVVEKVQQFSFDVIQLHGNESPEYCAELRKLNAELVSASHPDNDVPALTPVEVWKVFSIKDEFDFTALEEYEPVIDKFLFDTKGKEKGGNGYTFDWEVLKDYPSKKPFILSGGIGLDEINSVKNMLKTYLPLFAIDVNSKFEDQPGLKNIDLLKSLVKDLNR